MKKHNVTTVTVICDVIMHAPYVKLLENLITLVEIPKLRVGTLNQIRST